MGYRDMLRFTEQISTDYWMTRCKVCPKRNGRHYGPTQQAVDHWWSEHVETDLHKRIAIQDTAATPEEMLLHQIFGGADPRTKTAPRDRAGHTLVRAHAQKFRKEDNPMREA